MPGGSFKKRGKCLRGLNSKGVAASVYRNEPFSRVKLLPLEKLSVSHYLLLDTEGARKPYTELVFGPEREWGAPEVARGTGTMPPVERPTYGTRSAGEEGSRLRQTWDNTKYRFTFRLGAVRLKSLNSVMR